MKTNVALVALVASLLTIAAGRQLLQSGTARVTFFDNGNYSGGGQAFSTDVPATGCGSCENLNFVRTNSWESYTSNAGTIIHLYDGHFCTGKDSGPLPAKEGKITGSLSDSVDSFRVCASET
ncbi:g8518 [Coccomyxa viridis]|uniref:G8518 protein n=1 Tax=Coccomyxa viridis TaxID=1274662 RepID=A0ABP1G2X8_9CHLO